MVPEFAVRIDLCTIRDGYCPFSTATTNIPELTPLASLKGDIRIEQLCMSSTGGRGPWCWLSARGALLRTLISDPGKRGRLGSVPHRRARPTELRLAFDPSSD